ncbi:kallikrein-1-like [Chrysoperla carnea]|uniref:kallikrein-1-like n=1 Tax=Chrysoperla carnea TaxID=189513 RepID=UPI001D073DAC|nr:kallikrein-1-like [Chrysoperla carnea]
MGSRFLHPSYNVILKKDGSLKDIAYDVALLILRNHLPTTFSKIKLSRKDLEAGDVAEVAGWGLINKYNDTDFLQRAQVSILDDNNCKIKAKVSVPDVICAVPGLDGGLPCVGDSGGPLVKNVTDVE